MVVDFDILRFDAGLCVDYNALEFLRLFRERLPPCILDYTNRARALAPWRGPQRSHSASREPPSRSPTVVVACSVPTARLTSACPLRRPSYIGPTASHIGAVFPVRSFALYEH